MSSESSQVERSRQDPEQAREQYDELLSEIRVMLPGAEVLFAFLLTAVFSSRFEAVDQLGKTLFLVSLTSAALTILLLITPTLIHRLSDLDRRRRVRIATNFQLAASISVGVSICSGLFVVVRFVFAQPVALALTAGVAVTWVGLWYVLPGVLGRRIAQE